ncbi:hypothetical protein GGR51DRAFT_439422 [Nemania sp. FL0031]|nr:hypothetical protein GGR51DRAFT_439422 [Nemania sp. FL0031]
MGTTGLMADESPTVATSESTREVQYTYVQKQDELEQKLELMEAETKHKEKQWERVIRDLQGELERLRIRVSQLELNEEVYRYDVSEFQTPNCQLPLQLSSQSSNNQARDAAGTSTSKKRMQLHDAIAVGRDALPHEIHLVRNQVNIHLKPPLNDRVPDLLIAEKFVSWMRDRRSSILLAEDDVTINRRPVSPVSLFCANIAENLANRNSGTIALLFCASLSVSTEPTSGPKDMMRVLIAQLLSYSSMKTKLNLEFMTSDRLEVYKNHKLKPLCDLFITLVGQLPAGTDVFCIIDGISWYEQQWLADLKVVANMFLYLMKNRLPKYTATLKVLMTSDKKYGNVAS